MQIIHGDNQVASRNFLLSVKSRYRSDNKILLELDGRNLETTDLSSALSTPSLFGQSSVAFIDTVFSLPHSSKRTTLIKYLTEKSASQIIVWEPKDVSTQLKDFAPGSVRRFDLPKVIFKFLDTFSIPFYHQALATTPSEQILPLLASHLRSLIQVKSLPASHLKHISTWKLNSLKKQSEIYSLSSLVNALQSLVDIDFSTKSGNTPQSISELLELWLLSLHNQV